MNPYAMQENLQPNRALINPRSYKRFYPRPIKTAPSSSSFVRSHPTSMSTHMTPFTIERCLVSFKGGEKPEIGIEENQNLTTNFTSSVSLLLNLQEVLMQTFVYAHLKLYWPELGRLPMPTRLPISPTGRLEWTVASYNATDPPGCPSTGGVAD